MSQNYFQDDAKVDSISDSCKNIKHANYTLCKNDKKKRA